MNEGYHKELTRKMLEQPYFFARWFHCPACGHFQMLEKYKVFNNSK